MKPAWRLRCPKGHSGIQRIGTERYYCGTCMKYHAKSLYHRDEMIDYTREYERGRDGDTTGVSLGYIWSPSHGTGPYP